MKPQISVLTTVYNGEKYIKKTIESVLGQTFSNFEYIIIDDGSTDNTKKIIDSFNDKRIKYYYFGKNKGFFELHKPINFGLSKCKGKYIARLDSDDICYSNRIQKQYEYLITHPRIFMIGCSVELIDEFGNKVGSIIKKSYPHFFII